MSEQLPRHPEYQYLDLLADILENGDRRADRTGVGTLALFGTTMRFDLSDGTVPLFTTKKVFWKTAIKEMLWFLTGQTNLRSLLLENVRIWSDWPLDKYRRATGENISQDAFEARILDDESFARQWGDLGPIYGKQWRRWAGPDGREYDQIADLIMQIRTNPSSRRLLFHGWNVPDIPSMALPPCHLLYQFQVTSDGRLNAILYQRSVDTLIGLPFNNFCLSVLTAMIAQQCDLQPGAITWIGADTHIYLNHVDQVREQISRKPREFPTMRFVRRPASIDDYRIEDFIIEGYFPHPPIAAPVAV